MNTQTLGKWVLFSLTVAIAYWTAWNLHHQYAPWSNPLNIVLTATLFLMWLNRW